MKYLFSIITALLLTSCVSTQSTLKNVDNNAVRPAVKDKAYVITEYATDNKYGYDQDYPINIVSYMKNRKTLILNIILTDYKVRMVKKIS
ncbi:MAG: hypothetical protein LRY32_01955 [Flavobacterium sp.]|nr:hypothetical protein [Flavobacterium sp.]